MSDKTQNRESVLPESIDPGSLIPGEPITAGAGDDTVARFSLNIPIQNMWRIGIGLLCALLALVVVAKLNGESVDWSRMSEISPVLTGGLFLMIALAWICNGLRTWLMARTLGYPMGLVRAIGITLSSEFAIAATPGGVGGVGVRVLLQKRQGIPAMKSMAMFGTDVAADSIFFALLAPFGLAALLGIEPISKWAGIAWAGALSFLNPVDGYTSWILLMLAGSVCFTVWWLRHLRHRRQAKGSGRIHRYAHAAGERFRHWTDSMGDLWFRNKRVCALVVVIASIQWTCRYGVLVLLLNAMGVSMDPLALFLLQGSLFALSLVVVIPGGGGSVELLSSLILNPMMGSSALVVVVLWRFFTYYLYLLGGGIAFVLQAFIPSRASMGRVADPVSESVS